MGMATRIADGDFGVILGHTTARDEGDFAIDAEPTELAARRRAVADHPWVWLRQVHGSDVVVVTADNATDMAGAAGDALVTAEADIVLAIQTADCAPILLWSPEGVIGAAHGGWRGLEAGVIERTAEAMAGLGASDIRARVGPSIHAECYEFGEPDLTRLAERFGPAARGTTAAGTRALDIAELVETTTRRAGVELVDAGEPGCTSCDATRWFSHRARGESERMATVIWRDPEALPRDHR
jgi:polyphenol oxidase